MSTSVPLEHDPNLNAVALPPPERLRWALRTIATDLRTYRRRARPWSGARLRALLAPRLDDPLFVLGAPRSGTTFLGDALGALPEFSYHFEPVATKAAAAYVALGVWERERAAGFYRSVYGWLMRLHGDADLRFAEKTPRLVFVVPFLAAAFPRAQFVHIVRDGRDVALSLHRKRWLRAAAAASGRRDPGGNRDGAEPRFWVELARTEEFRRTGDLHRCIWAWRRHVEAARRDLATLPPARVHEVRYEALVRAPDREGERLLDALGVTSPDSRRALAAALQGAHDGSVGGWRDAFGPDDLAVVEAEAGALLRALGYAP